MLKQILHENWSVRAVGDLSEVPAEIRGQSFAAKVPGCVHTDLLRAGKIPDPYLDLNEYKLQWIGQTDWEYRTTFDADPELFDHERIDLACDGLDTVARIELNGTLLGSTANMHRSYRFDIRPHLKRGSNELRITFASPIKYAFAMREKLGSRPWVNGAGGPFNFIRKMACNFGWDWGPVLTTCGIWKAVRVEGWSKFRIKRIRTGSMKLFEDHAESGFGVDWEDASRELELRVHASILTPTGEVVDLGDMNPRRDWFAFDQPKLWYPKGYGDQAQYKLTVTLYDENTMGFTVPRPAPRTEKLVDCQTINFGFRTVELDTSPDSIGSKFVLKVNGKPIFCRGFNWIPDNCFLDRACEPARVRARIQQAVDAGANMLRVWGGGIYETDDFYNICDELGVMVWQDFPFACAMYPEEEPFRSEVEAEARENVARLNSHPSLVLWNGNNENLWAYRDWGWKEHEDVVGKTWGKNFYLDLLPRIIAEVDPSRPYWAASPWSGDRDVDDGIHPNDPNHGNMHIWRPWFHDDYTAYRNFPARFCSEFGFQAPANFASIARALGISVAATPASPDREEATQASRLQGERMRMLDFGSIEMRHRQKSTDARSDGDLRNLTHLARHFNLPGLQELIDSLTIPTPRTMPPPGVVQPLFPSKTPSQTNFDDLHYLLQVNQCRALTLGVEWFRSRMPTCMGTLYWQLNDCWPGVTSWSAIDGDGKPKPLWFATRNFYSPYLPTIQPEADGSLSLCLINDTDWPEPISNLHVTRFNFEMQPLAAQRVHCQVPARAVHRVPIDPEVATPTDPSRELIWFGDEHGTAWYFKPDKELHYPPPHFSADLKRVGEDYQLWITAKVLLRDVCVFVDRIDPDATINDQMITIFPNDTFVFVIRSQKPMTQEQLIAPPVFQCANRFGAGT